MSDEQTEVRGGVSSVEVSRNAKGEYAYKVKVYAETTQDQLDTMVAQAAATLKALVLGAS